VTVTLLAAGVAAASASARAADREGSILTGMDTPDAQYIIGKLEVHDVGEELRQLFVLAAVRDAFRAKFHLTSHGGHTSRAGYIRTCRGTLRVQRTTVFFEAWAKPGTRSFYDSEKAYLVMINPRRWHFSCATRE
jgi:hypothetical protein